MEKAAREAERTAETPASEAPATPAPASEAVEVPAATAARTATRVSLRWNAAVDMDLEIWNEEGTRILFRAWNKMGQDVTDGRAGEEYFEFRRVDGDDYSRGTYVVSVYFAARSDDSVDAADAVVTIRRPDGSTATRRKRIQWEPGVDQWHAFKINAATGRITDIDRFIRVRQQT